MKAEPPLDFTPRPWTEPAPLTRMIAPSTDYPVAALGDILGPAAQRIHEVVRAPLGMCCQSILAAATLTAQSQADFMHEPREPFPISGFFLTIGQSGERKTGVDKIALRAHKGFQAQRNYEYEALLKIYKKEAMLYALALKEAQRLKGSDRQYALDALIEPEAPLQPALVAQEPTYEGLLKLFRHGHPSLGIFASEGGKLIGGHAMNNDNKLKTIAGLSELWDGEAVSIIRAGEEPYTLYGRRLSVHLMFQPMVAAMIINDPLSVDQGFMSRCLTVFPTSTIGDRPYNREKLRDDPHMIKYWESQDKILNFADRLLPGARNALEPRHITFTEDAAEIWETFHDGVDAEQKPGRKYAGITGFASKAPEMCQRLAAVLAITENPTTDHVDSETLCRAMDLMEFYLAETVRLAEMGRAAPEIETAVKLLDWLKYRGGSTYKLADVYQRGPKEVRDRGTAGKINAILFEHGYVRPVKVGEYEINPEVIR